VTFSQDWYKQEAFHTFWRGWPMVKCWLDLGEYHHIIWQTKPELIVETGTYAGGSALYFADTLRAVEQDRDDTNEFNGAEVISIDISNEGDLPDDHRIEFIRGRSSTDLRVLEHVTARAKGRKTMVVLDSDHSEEHVLKELRAYAPLVSVGAYLIVEDTNPDAYRQLGFAEHEGAGPARALREWQPQNHGFKVDERRERFLFSQNPGGYLKRVR
jgi:cephalosporin hydroxylase